jgi:cell division protease FtsH
VDRWRTRGPDEGLSIDRGHVDHTIRDMSKLSFVAVTAASASTRRLALSVLALLTVLTFSPFVAGASAAETTSEVVSNTAVEPNAEAGTSGDLPLLDPKGVPYMETAMYSPYVDTLLVTQLAESGELASAFIDDKLQRMVLLTDGGVVLSSPYDRDPELLQALFDAKVIPAFVTFDEAPRQEIQRIEDQRKGFEWMRLGLVLPLVIMIGGSAIIYELRQRKLRKEQKVEEGTTAFQTREGGGSIPTVTFDDVAGCEEAIEDLAEIAEFLKDPARFEKLGAKVPRGAILAGPPGTGKTLLARAVAGEAKVPFFAASGSDFVEMYVGVGPMRVRELFAKARAEEKAIVFIDEIDAVARARATTTKQNSNDERENTLNALLNELDGFSRGNVILLAATNRVDMLDPAILRPGRLDRKIQVPNPDRRGREKILEVHTDGKPLAKDVDLAQVARRTPGMSGADLSQIANEAAIEAARRGLKAIDASCFSSAVALVAMGRARRSALITDRDRLITAYHEAGHTICALLHPDAPAPVSVSITPRGHAGGITWMNGSDDQYMARPQAAAQLIVAMGGRAGEELLLDGEFTQGPSSDLERATQLATVMVTRYGMTRRGLAVRSGEPDNVSHDVIEELLGGALGDARELLRDNQPLFLAIVNQLLEHETLEFNDLEEIRASLGTEDIGQEPIGARTMQVLQQAGQTASAVGAAVAKAGLSVLRTPVPKRRQAGPKVEAQTGTKAVGNAELKDETGAQTPAGTADGTPRLDLGMPSPASRKPASRRRVLPDTVTKSSKPRRTSRRRADDKGKKVLD